MSGFSEKSVPDRAARRDGGGIPVVIISGFLGAGKTSLLNHLLDYSAASKIAVIVNDFGDIGIDARLIRNADSIIELSGGCICCKSTGDFRQAITRMLDSEYSFDGLFVETSGLADPSVLATYVSEMRVVTPLRLGGVVTVIDALNFDRNLEIAEVAFQQLSAADLFVVNKCDRVAPEKRGLIEGALQSINKDAAVLFTVNGLMSRQELFEALGAHRVGQVPVEKSSHEHTHREPFMSVVVSSASPLNRRKFEQWLDNLPVGVQRAKGPVLLIDAATPQLLQLVRRDRKLTPLEGADFGEQTQIVLIGFDLDQPELQRGLEKCGDENA